MDTLVDEPAAQDASARLARRVRLEREMRGWSLADLAARSGVAKATISKIEREEASPTAVVLVRLAGAFDLTLAGLLLRAEGTGDLLSRAADQPVWRDPETGYRRKQVFARPDHPLEITRVELPAGRQVTMPASSYAHIRQAVWVEKGRLVIVEGDERRALGAGDCLGFGPPSEVTFANEGAAACSYVVVLARS
jgi:transcriptional regulator with XRE-family HTH domain